MVDDANALNSQRGRGARGRGWSDEKQVPHLWVAATVEYLYLFLPQMRQNSKASVHEQLHGFFSLMEEDELALYRNHSFENLTLVCSPRNLPLDSLLCLGEGRRVQSGNHVQHRGEIQTRAVSNHHHHVWRTINLATRLV